VDERVLDLAFRFGLPVGLLVLAFFTGSAVERRHYASIRRREQRARHFPVLTFREVPPGWRVEESALVTGSVVISLDHFKRFLAGLRNLVGGRVAAYESLLDRARREAVLRLQEKAFADGYRAVINLRLETYQTAGAGDGQGTAGVEVLAYGTALRLARTAA
jgi:uncharacterized protein YbjQ (UPF0145 family)